MGAFPEDRLEGSKPIEVDNGQDNPKPQIFYNIDLGTGVLSHRTPNLSLSPHVPVNFL